MPVEVQLVSAATARALAGPAEPCPGDIERMLDRAAAAEFSPVGPERIAEINAVALAFYQNAFADSWGRDYLHHRLGVDLHRHPRYRPGHAPAGWTHLIDHLRRHAVSDAELLAAGLAVTARTGNLIDRFRDRVLFPILARSAGRASDAGGVTVLGFIGRRRPDHDDTAGPKYLNTSETVLYHKGAQLYGAEHLPSPAASAATGTVGGSVIPVLVEGPMDAIAVTLAGGGRYIGVAPLGTSLTEDQVRQLAAAGSDPIVATDADVPGQIAAERAYWMLTAHRLDPRHARFPAGADPADLLTRDGPLALTAALDDAAALGRSILEERLSHLPADQALPHALDAIAARPVHTWGEGLDQLCDHLHQPLAEARRRLLPAVRRWTSDPRRAATAALNALPAVRARLEETAGQPPQQHRLAADLSVAEPQAPSPLVAASAAERRRRAAVPAPGSYTPGR